MIVYLLFAYIFNHTCGLFEHYRFASNSVQFVWLYMAMELGDRWKLYFFGEIYELILKPARDA